MHSAEPYLVLIRDIAWLRPSEYIDEQHAAQLAREIETLGRWLTPIPVEHATGIVMDGNHRLRAAALLGLTQLPCVALDYADARVQVTDWRGGQAYPVAHLFAAISAGRLLPYKSTKHVFAPELPRIDVALADLGQAPATHRAELQPLPHSQLERA